MDTSKLITALRWREDVAGGEMIEQRKDGESYTRTYLGFKSVSQDELDNICEAANTWWKESDSDLRIGNSMGEIIPGKEA
jgi:hypothetical protein